MHTIKLPDHLKPRIVTMESIGMKPLYQVERKDEKNKHFYTIDGWATSYVGVSTVLNVLNKPYLLPWGVKMGTERMAREMIKYRDRIMKIYKMSPENSSKPMFSWETIQSVIGDLCSNETIERIAIKSKKEPDRIKNQALNIGTRAHQAIDDIIKGGEPEIAEDIYLPVEGFLTWLGQTNLTIVSGDIKVASKEAEFGGSIDCLAIDPKGDLHLLDWKTSKQFSKDYCAQLGGYVKALMETYGLTTFPRAHIVRFDKTKPEVEIRSIRFLLEAWKAFEALLWTHKLMQIEFYDEKEKFKFTPKMKKQKEPTNANTSAKSI